MNIFILDPDPVIAAKYHCDSHMKMILEMAQMLCTNYHLQGVDAPYRKTHENHPSTKWLRSSYDNFLWGIEHAFALLQEYTNRYDKRHKSQDVIEWCESNIWQLDLLDIGLTPFVLAINSDKKCRQDPSWDESDPVHCYRLFYKHDKSSFAKWKLGNIPEWYL